MARVNGEICEYCEKVLASQYCTDCEQLYCDKCKTKHLQSKSNNIHKFVAVGVKPKHECKKHRKDFILYCETCKTLICNLCTTDGHNKHFYEQIDKRANDLKSQAYSKLQDKKETLTNLIVTMQEKRKSFIDNVKRIEKEIRELGRAIKDAVDEQVDSLVKLLKEKEGTEIQFLSTVNKEYEELLSRGKKYAEDFTNISAEKENVTVMSKMEELISSLDTIKPNDPPEFPSISYKPKNKTTIVTDNMLGNLSFREGTRKGQKPQPGNTEHLDSTKEEECEFMEPVNAQVMVCDDSTKEWAPVSCLDQSRLVKVQIFHNIEKNTFRVVGSKVVLNYQVLKTTRLDSLGPNFHYWRHQNHCYGLNYASVDDADTFATALTSAVDMLNCM